MAKNLFLIYTPYQMMSAVNTVITYKMKNSDFLFVHENAGKYAEVCASYIDGKVYKKYDLYQQKPHKNLMLRRIQIIFNIFRVKKVAKVYNLFEKKYEELIVPSDDVVCRAAYYYLKLENNGIILSMFDDGVGTYDGTVFRKKTFIGDRLYSLLLDRGFCEKINKVYCYHPELIKKEENTQYRKINNTELSLLFNELSTVEIDEYIGKKVLFLDQGIRDNDVIKECLDILSKHFSKDEIIIKMHPRIKSSNGYHSYKQVNDSLPLEAIFEKLHCSKCLVISYSSTGCITPYMICNQTPYAVILSKMDKIRTTYARNTISFFYLINKRMNMEYVHMPESISELDSYIQRIKDNVVSIF